MHNYLKAFAISLLLIVGGTAYAAGKNSGDKVDTATPHPGKKLYESTCLQCHAHHGKKHGMKKGEHSKKKDDRSEKKTQHKRLAPPMHAVKRHYIKDYPEKKAFVKAVSSWAKKPDAKKAKLEHAVEKFGLMPPQNLKKKELKRIAAYIYDKEFKKGHGCKHKKEGSCKHKEREDSCRHEKGGKSKEGEKSCKMKGHGDSH